MELARLLGCHALLSSFNNKLERRFERLEDDFDDLQDRVTDNYVLKEDFFKRNGISPFKT